MSSGPSLQPQWCDECGKPEMLWQISLTDTDTEQNENKDTGSQAGSVDAVVGNKVERGTEEAKEEGLTISGGGGHAFYLCTDPTCKGHSSTLSEIVRQKLVRLSDREYSGEEIENTTNDVVKQSIRDHQTVIETVEELSDTKAADAIRDTARAEEAPPQQFGPCRCGKQQYSDNESVNETETEQQSEKNIARKIRSFNVTVPAFLNIGVGGETTSGDETTTKEISTSSTRDTVVFPICRDARCEERLGMFGMIECWKMRNDPSREYSDAEVNETLQKGLVKEISSDKRATKGGKDAREEMLGTAEQDTATASSQTETESSLTDPLYEQLDEVDPTDEHALEDEIADLGGQYKRTETLVSRLEVNTDSNTERNVAQQQLLDQLAAMETQDTESAAQIEQLTENVTGVDPALPQADDQLDLFAGQVTDLEQHEEIHIEQTTQTELQQLETRLDAIDVDDEKLMERHDSLQEDVASLEQQYEETEEKLTTLVEQNTPEQREKSDSNQQEQSENTKANEKETTSISTSTSISTEQTESEERERARRDRRH